MFFLLLIACQNTPSTVQLGGTISEYEDGDALYLWRSADRVNYREWMRSLDTVEVSAIGEFSFTVPADAPDCYQVTGEEGFPLFHDVYLEPGDSLWVNVPLRSDTSRIDYMGARSAAYAGHHFIDSLWSSDPLFQLNYYDLAQMDIDSAWEVLKTRQNTAVSVLRNCFRGHPEWSPLSDMIIENIKYRNLRDHYDYLYYHNYYTSDTFLYLVPEMQYYEFVDTMDLTQPPEYYSFDYMMFLSAFLRDHFNRDHAELDDSTKYADKFQLMRTTARRYLTGEALDMAFIAIAGEFGFYLAQDNFFSELDSMDKELSSMHNSALNYQKFQHLKSGFENLRPGKRAPDIALPNVDGDTIRLSDHLGKVLYIDFWGTWCYPCLQEFPHSLELQETFADKPVEFIYVGLESGEDQIITWKEFILGERSLSYAPFLEQRVYPGLHLLADGQFGNPALKPYMLMMAPTYVLIDTEGRIVSANAPRPSDEEIVTMINAALHSDD